MADATANRGKAFVAVLSCVLSRLVAANDAVRARGTRGLLLPLELVAHSPAPLGARSPLLQQPASAQVVSKFHALRPPSISTRDYLERCVGVHARGGVVLDERADACA